MNFYVYLWGVVVDGIIEFRMEYLCFRILGETNYNLRKLILVNFAFLEDILTISSKFSPIFSSIIVAIPKMKSDFGENLEVKIHQKFKCCHKVYYL